MRATIVSFFALLMILSGSITTLAQDLEAEYFAVLEDQVKPAMISAYEGSLIDLNDLMEEKGIESYTGPVISLSETSTYLKIFQPVKNCCGIEKIISETSDISKINKKLDEKIQASKEYHKWLVVRQRPDLSYKPEDAASGSEENSYYHFTYFWGSNDKKTALEDSCNEWIELYKQNEIQHGYMVFEAVMGEKLPLLIFMYTAKNPADFYKIRNEISQKLGFSEMKLLEKTMKVCRKYEVKSGLLRPYLSNMRGW
jgi:hypothetical protein